MKVITKVRECTPLVASSKYFGINETIIVTMDTHQNLEFDGLKIRVVPIWKWLIDPQI